MSEGYASDGERVRCHEGTKVNHLQFNISLRLVSRHPLLLVLQPRMSQYVRAIYGLSGVRRRDLRARISRSGN